MKRQNWIFFLMVFLSPVCLFAGKDPVALPADILQKLKAQSTKSQVMEIAFHLTDVTGPRLTISPGFTKAANWAVNTLTGYGLQNARLEPWGEFGKGWEQQKCYVAITAPYYQPLIAIPKAWSGSTPGKKELMDAVILVNATDSASFVNGYKGKLKGKIVMLVIADSLQPSFEADASRYTDSELQKMAENKPSVKTGEFTRDSSMVRRFRQYSAMRILNDLLYQEEPALVLAYGRGSDGTIAVQGASSNAYKKDTKELPASVAISPGDYLKIQRLLKAGIPVKIEADVKNRLYTEDTKGYNVVAEIPGTDPLLREEVVMLGAHLDSWQGSTGATDNAAGCAMMMEAARLIISSGLAPKRTIRIILWSGEEQGTYGSRGWVKNHLGDPASMILGPEHDNVVAYYNLDNGSGRIRGIYSEGNEKAAAFFQEWLNSLGDPAAKTVTLQKTGSTDHVSFDAVGVPGFQFIQDKLEYDTRTHHTNMDDYDHLVEADLVQGSLVAAWFAINTAQSEEKLPRKELPKARLK